MNQIQKEKLTQYYFLAEARTIKSFPLRLTASYLRCLAHMSAPSESAMKDAVALEIGYGDFQNVVRYFNSEEKALEFILKEAGKDEN